MFDHQSFYTYGVYPLLSYLFDTKYFVYFLMADSRGSEFNHLFTPREEGILPWGKLVVKILFPLWLKNSLRKGYKTDETVIVLCLRIRKWMKLRKYISSKEHSSSIALSTSENWKIQRAKPPKVAKETNLSIKGGELEIYG